MVVVVLGGAGTPLPDSVASSAPLQSGSPVSTSPSPSSSAVFEHWGTTSTVVEPSGTGTSAPPSVPDPGACGTREQAGAEDRETQRD